MTYNQIIDYISVLVGFMLPFIILADIYVMIKTKQYRNLDIIKAIVVSIIVVLSYYHLQPKQRLLLLLITSSVVLIFVSVITVSKLFKRR